MSRQDQNAVTLTIDGRDLGIWDKLAGGEIDSDELQFKPGAMGSAVSLGGSVQVGELTLSRLYVLSRDHASIQWLISRVGKGDCTAARQPLDPDGNVYGGPIVYTGKLKTVTLPEIDSESSDAALLEIAITPNGKVA
jgi:hypothetical protein